MFCFDRKYEDLFEIENLIDCVTYNGLLGAKELFRKMGDYDLLLQLRANQQGEEHFKSSKCYELIMIKRPIMYIGLKSELSNYIVENKLGFSFDSMGQEMGLVNDVLDNRKKNIVPQPFDIDNLSFKEQVREVISFLK